ncbi:cholesterol 24-hydroxylase [Acrasis kona]|uniref:Cholesterol 24-hydroxylase n=1 Tax=Acrasis kona TaxID=1008807 RepID=A0AAW2ZGS0_9EUKA
MLQILQTVAYLFLSAVAIILLLIIIAVFAYFKNKRKLSHLPGYCQFIPAQLVKRNSFLSKYLYTNTEIVYSKVPEFIEKYGPVYKVVSAVGRPLIFITDGDFAKIITSKGYKLFEKDRNGSDKFHELFNGDNVFTVSDEVQWRKHRLLLNPAFTDDNLSDAVITFTNKTIQELMDKINKQSNVREVSSDMSGLTLDIIGRAGFGYEFGCTDASSRKTELSLSEKTKSLMGSFPTYFLTPTKFVRQNLKVGSLKALHDCKDSFVSEIAAIIAKRSKEGEEEAANDMLSLLLRAREEQGERFSDYELIANCFIMIVAGHETTSQTLSYALYLLAKHPHIQEEAYSFIKSKIPDHHSRSFNYIDYSENLSYIHNIFDETLRMYPVAVGVVRKLKSDLEFKGYKLPKDTAVFYNWSVEFVSEKNFTNPEQFIPNRWNDQGSGQNKIYTPFGIGNRSCIGKKFAKIESVLCLARLICNYKISLKDPNYVMDTDVNVTMQPAKPFFAIFTKRQ